MEVSQDMVVDGTVGGVVYDIQGFSVQDGPGIRTTVFEKGCPLRCPWCHSPESQRYDIQLSYQKDKCIGVDACGLCLKQGVCPEGALSVGDAVTTLRGDTIRPVELDWERCSECLRCAAPNGACPANALLEWGKTYTVDEVVEIANRDRAFYEHSGGGVTVSGGEPLTQIDFTVNLLAALKQADIDTALDTTLFATWDAVERTLPYTDLYLVDIKHMHSKEHEAVVGVPNECILENTRLLAKAGARIRVRVPTIPHFNDSDENFEELGVFARELGESLQEIQILPYHTLGVAKWARIKHQNKVFEASMIPDERIQQLAGILKEMGLPVIVH